MDEAEEMDPNGKCGRKANQNTLMIDNRKAEIE